MSKLLCPRRECAARVSARGRNCQASSLDAADGPRRRQAPLAAAATRELRVRQGIDYPCKQLNQLDHRVRRRLRFAVKADDKTRSNKKAVGVD